jgi:hypothetical protein
VDGILTAQGAEERERVAPRFRIARVVGQHGPAADRDRPELRPRALPAAFRLELCLVPVGTADFAWLFHRCLHDSCVATYRTRHVADTKIAAGSGSAGVRP